MEYQKATDEFVETEIDGELVLMHLDSGKFHALKDTGLAIWRLLDDNLAKDSIQEALIQQFDVDAATCENELSAFLDSMAQAGFVKKI